MKTSILIASAAVLLSLGACGGGGTDTPLPVTDAVPDEASASAQGMTQWLSQVAATMPEDREPLATARFAPPQPDDTEPVPLR